MQDLVQPTTNGMGHPFVFWLKIKKVSYLLGYETFKNFDRYQIVIVGSKRSR